MGMEIIYVVRQLGNRGDKSAPEKYFLSSEIRREKQRGFLN